MTIAKTEKAWVNARVMTCENDLTILDDHAITVSQNKITWVGPSNELNKKKIDEVIDVEGRLITPGLIDCHTHLIYGGNRANEFAMRLEGISYTEIARKGGGIQSTVQQTRNSSFDELYSSASQRLVECMSNGVTTIEIKSGYGLNLETEVKMLEVAKKLSETYPVHIVKTFLGAHSIPKEFQHRSMEYIRYLCEEVLPYLVKNKLVDAVDIFCEHIAFNLQEAELLFTTAKKFDLPIKCHAEQLSNMGASTLAARHQAISVDHLEYLSEEDIDVLASTNTVAVLLPAAFYFLREKNSPPIKSLRAHQIPIAVASDHNPGTSPILSLLTVMNMGATLFDLTPTELWLGVTKYAARALGLRDIGTIAPSKYANFAIWNVSSPIELIYYVRQPPLFQRVVDGYF